MPPRNDPLCRLKGRAVFEDTLRDFWLNQIPPVSLRWPRFDRHYLDTYYMYEVLQALGGLEVVVQERKFSHVKRLLHISESYTAFSTTGRQHYERWVSPCEEAIRKAVEDEYRRNGDWVDNYTWLRAAAENPTAEISNNLEKFKELDETLQAVTRARYSLNHLHESEKTGTYPNGLTSSCPETVRLDLRNHIIRMWYRAPSRRLDVYTAVRDIPAKYHGVACAIYTQLVVTGAINSGAVPFTTPVAVKFARDSNQRRRVAVIGAGFAGLTVARQLRAFGISVTVFEARDRIGGRVHSTTDGGFSTEVDVGAMLITGLIQSPIALLVEQTDIDLHTIEPAVKLYDVDGKICPHDVDTRAENEYNSTLDVTANYRRHMQSSPEIQSFSLGTAFKNALACREHLRSGNSMTKSSDVSSTQVNHDGKIANISDKSSSTANGTGNGNSIKSRSQEESIMESNNAGESSTEAMEIDTKSEGDTNASPSTSKLPKDLPGIDVVAKKLAMGEPVLPALSKENFDKFHRLIHWHVANLEYACAADLSTVSLTHWDQDDPFGFLGDHALVKSGFKRLVDALAVGMERNIKLNSVLTGIKYYPMEDENSKAEVEVVSNGVKRNEQFDAVIITVPLGVLKTGKIRFEPELPSFKKEAIQRLGCGGLMKVILEFPNKFWDDDGDMFGNLRETEETRGEFYIFWNMHPCSDKPILIGMVSEPAASKLEQMDDASIVARAMNVLRRRYPEAPYPIAKAITRWGLDEYSHGVYTSISTGSSGLDYDLIGARSGNLFFAGEHTCRKYPTTCASAVISGLREARNIVEHFKMVEKINSVHARALYDATHTATADDKRRTIQEPWQQSAQQVNAS